VAWQSGREGVTLEIAGLEIGRESLLMKWSGCCVLIAMLTLSGRGQTPLRAAVPPPVTEIFSPGPSLASPSLGKPDPNRTFRDPMYRVAFEYPSNWNLSRSDGEVSTFHLDARSAPRSTIMRAVVSIPENPFPESTFSGAYAYFSVTPHASARSCARQAAAGKQAPLSLQIGGIPFIHGHDEQRDICITQRDEVYTTYRRGACYRFDLAMNNFCGGEVSGVKDVTAKELDQVRGRLETILWSFRFETK
jgi:hypothetical protein